jgi:hypothetical protein
MVGGQPAAEEAQVPLDGGDGRRAQAQADLGDVALRRLVVGTGDAGPAALADRDVAGSGDGVDGLVVEQGGLQPVQHRSGIPPCLGPWASAVGVQQQLASGEEAGGVDPVNGGSGRGGEHRQHVPLQRGVGRGGCQPRGGLRKPQAGRGLVAGRCRAQPHPRRHQEAGFDLQAAGDDQPGDERRGVLGLGRGQPLLVAQCRPAAGAVQAAAERLGGLPAGPPQPQPGRLDRLAVLLDQVSGGCRQWRRGRHHAPPMVWASIAWTARRYSSASQSLLRCR